MNYRPRNDFVLYRVVNRGMHRGVVMPDRAAQGKDHVVVAVGPKVVDLKPGDHVKVIGTPGQDVVPLPDDSSLFLTREQNVVLVVDAEPQAKAVPCSPEEAG